MYVDYSYYKNVYGGVKVSEEEFNKYELKARLVLDNYTKKPKLTLKLLDGKHSDRIKMTMCELIDNTKEEEELMANAMKTISSQLSGIKSESVKDHSWSFSDKNSVEQVKAYINGKDMDVIYRYLIPTNLLYAGARVE